MPKSPSWAALIEAEGCLVLPGAYDALSARLIARAGFKAYVVGGYGLVGARYGLPDIGLAGLGEMAEGVRDIMRGSDLPLLVDGDTGYGDAKNVAHTIHTYERMGAAAILIEDQVMPKRCGHFAGKDVVEPPVMEERIRAASEARTSKDFFLIARTDARAVHGLDETLRRAERYLAAGADELFVEAPESVAELERIARAFDVPQMCNMLVGGRTPILPNRDLAEMGYAMIVHGTTLVMRVAQALAGSLAAIRDDKPEPAEAFMDFDEYKDALGLPEWVALERRHGRDDG